MHARHGEDLGLVERGFRDDLSRDTLRRAWEAQPKEARGESPGKWWENVEAAHKAYVADPKKAAAPVVPQVLAPFLPQAEQPAQPVAKRGAAPVVGERKPLTLESIPADADLFTFLQALKSMEG
jgi:hypothetical protein